MRKYFKLKVICFLVVIMSSCTQEEVNNDFITVPENFLGTWEFESNDGLRSGRLIITSDNIIEEFIVGEDFVLNNYEERYNSSDFIVSDNDFINEDGFFRYVFRVSNSIEDEDILFERNLSYIQELGGIQVDQSNFFGEIFTRLE